MSTAPSDSGVAGELPRPEYPRPHFDRSHTWRPLNGDWDFHRDPEGTRTTPPGPGEWAERITVPFAWETAASGVAVHWLAAAWYRRRVTVPPEWAGQRVVLHVGAAHHEATVWCAGRRVGGHVGGYLPFEVDLTDALAGRDRSELVIGVRAPVDKRDIPHGKQRSLPADPYDNCSFTPHSGIWQSVWLEARPATHLAGLSLRPTDGLDGIRVGVTVAGPASATAAVHVALQPGGEPVACPLDGHGNGSVVVPVPRPRRWEPTDPHLYRVSVEVDSPDGRDRVTGTTGLRSVTTDGETLLLNGRRVFLRGVLDQGWWPASGPTAPTEAALVADLELARDCGFSLVRKHAKLEDPRWLAHADRLGVLVWAEPPGTGRWSDAATSSFAGQLAPMVARDGDHPCIVVWGLYNEEWGLDWDLAGDPAKRRAVAEAYDRLRALDDSRPVVDNSGWSHVRTDLLDWHVYSPDLPAWRSALADLADGGAGGFPVALSPGGPVTLHLSADGRPARGRPSLNSEYGVGLTPVERAWSMRWQTQELRRHDGFSGYVYTELYDVEHEQAGVLSAHRTAKDDMGTDPATVHAPTVLVSDLVPHRPGADLVTDPDGHLAVGVRVSHHGPAELTGTLSVRWGPPLGRVPPVGGARPVARVRVRPFRVSEPVAVTDTLAGEAGRLHLLVHDEHGRLRARSHLDVVGPSTAGSAARPVDGSLAFGLPADRPPGGSAG